LLANVEDFVEHGDELHVRSSLLPSCSPFNDDDDDGNVDGNVDDEDAFVDRNCVGKFLFFVLQLVSWIYRDTGTSSVHTWIKMR
jgi:hypothetical protein